MVRANCANTNAKIHAPLASHPQARRSRLNATLPGRGRRNGLPAGLGPAEGGRAWGAQRARLRRASPRREAATLAHA
jgi:hypothetical protein